MCDDFKNVLVWPIYWFLWLFIDGILHLISIGNLKLLHVWMIGINAARPLFNDVTAIFSHTLLFRRQLTHIFLLDERKLNFCFLFLSSYFSIWPFYSIKIRNFTPDSSIFSHKKSSRCWKYGTLKRVVGDRFCNWFRSSTEILTGVFCWNHFTLVITYLFFFRQSEMNSSVKSNSIEIGFFSGAFPSLFAQTCTINLFDGYWQMSPCFHTHISNKQKKNRKFVHDLCLVEMERYVVCNCR